MRTFAAQIGNDTVLATLEYGVMVTLQILVLSFQVRILVLQHTEADPIKVSLSVFIKSASPQQAPPSDRPKP